MLRNAKSFMKRYFPNSVPAYIKVKEICRGAFYGDRYMPSVFSQIHRNNLWGEQESVSGNGSSLAATANLRQELPPLLAGLNITSLLDAPCGDFNWMKEVSHGGLTYIGADVVPEIITRNHELYGSDNRQFIVLDVTKDVLPRVDLILCRDLLIHFSFRYIASTIENFIKTGSEYLLVTTDTAVQDNEDILTGQWRPLNLQLHPFNFPKPIKLIIESPERGRSMGLWRLKDLKR